MGSQSGLAEPADVARDLFTRELVEQGLLVQTGVQGVFGKNGVFEAIVRGIDGLVEREGATVGAEVFRFPPVISRALLERRPCDAVALEVHVNSERGGL